MNVSQLLSYIPFVRKISYKDLEAKYLAAMQDNTELRTSHLGLQSKIEELKDKHSHALQSLSMMESEYKDAVTRIDEITALKKTHEDECVVHIEQLNNEVLTLKTQYEDECRGRVQAQADVAALDTKYSNLYYQVGLYVRKNALDVAPLARLVGFDPQA